MRCPWRGADVSVPRTQERMWHDVGLPAETVELRGEVWLAVEKAFRLEELYRDAKILEILGGADEVLQWVIARQLIGRDVTG
jgi:alkylation response protein AidB-like acyl-CoA dehydrogenase